MHCKAKRQSVNHDIQDIQVDSDNQVDSGRIRKKQANTGVRFQRTLSPDEIVKAIQNAIDERQEALAQWDQPEADHWMTPGFFIVRHLKGIAQLQDADPGEVFSWVRELISAGYCAEIYAPDDELEALDLDEDTEADWYTAWERVKFPAGQDSLTAAVDRAALTTFNLPDDIARRRSPGYATFLSIAYHLQSDRPGDTILLPVKRLADHLGVKAMTISRYRAWAIADGFLTEVRESSSHGRATEFRFRGGA